jgi:hypothetical protein
MRSHQLQRCALATLLALVACERATPPLYPTSPTVLTDSSSAPPPPPPSGGVTWPNEPAGWTLVNNHDMSGLNTGGWANVYPADITSGGISVVSDPSAPASPPSVWQFAYPAGFTAAGTAPATEWMPFAPAQALYVGFWWKPSNPWQGHESGVNKLMFAFTGDPTGLSQNLTIPAVRLRRRALQHAHGGRRLRGRAVLGKRELDEPAGAGRVA